MSDRAQVVSTALTRVPQLTMLPDVAVQVLRIADDPSSSVREMADMVAHSPTLCPTPVREQAITMSRTTVRVSNERGGLVWNGRFLWGISALCGCGCTAGPCHGASSAE